MYTEENRAQLLDDIVTFVKANEEFEGLIQIGSGANGFTDIYSDIDLMAGCKDASAVVSAKQKLCVFFQEKNAVYLDFRKWSKTIRGISAYFENGLSVDISFMPTQEIPVLSRQLRLVWAFNKEFENLISTRLTALKEQTGTAVDDAFHHKFFYALRRTEIAMLRNNCIYADVCLSEARQMLLLVEALVEGKKVHQFKAYNTLNQAFLSAVEKTYPKQRTQAEIKKAKDRLLDIYLHTIEHNNLSKVDGAQFKLIDWVSNLDVSEQ